MKQRLKDEAEQRIADATQRIVQQLGEAEERARRAEVRHADVFPVLVAGAALHLSRCFDVIRCNIGALRDIVRASFSRACVGVHHFCTS
jgi:hypothetical protein